MMTYEDAARKYANMVHNNSTATFLDKDDAGFLGVVVRGVKNEINKLRSAETIQTLFADKENRRIILNITTLEHPNIEDGYNIPIIVDNNEMKETMIRLSNGTGKAEMYLASNELDILAVKPVMSSEEIREILRLRLIDLGIIKE